LESLLLNIFFFLWDVSKRIAHSNIVANTTEKNRKRNQSKALLAVKPGVEGFTLHIKFWSYRL
jgi:hypothetical protein